ncbi:MAG: hypothetical protein ACKVOE_02405 [Rickettsiales bacterium]
MEHASDIAEPAHELWYHSPEVWVAVAFVLFIGVALKWVVPPIVRGLDARGQVIRDQLEQASKLRAEAAALLASYQQQQETKLREAEAILDAARKDAVHLRARAAEDLKQTLARRMAQAEEKIARAEATALAQLRRQMVEQASTRTHAALVAQVTSEATDPALAHALAAIEAQLGAPAEGVATPATPRRAKTA